MYAMRPATPERPHVATDDEIQEALTDALAHPDAALSGVKETPGEVNIQRHSPFEIARALNTMDKRLARERGGRRFRVKLVDG